MRCVLQAWAQDEGSITVGSDSFTGASSGFQFGFGLKTDGVQIGPGNDFISVECDVHSDDISGVQSAVPNPRSVHIVSKLDLDGSRMALTWA